MEKLDLCKKGHKFTQENTYIAPSSGKRRCRLCRKEYSRNYHKENFDKLQERGRHWRKNNTEHSILYRKNRREQTREYDFQYRKDNFKKLREYRHLRYINNLEKHREYQKTWVVENRDKCREYSRQRRAFKRNGLGNFKLWMLKYNLYTQDNSCYYCGSDISNYYELEHKIPLSKGGFHSWENACLSCRSCNRRKNTMTDKEFLAEEYRRKEGTYAAKTDPQSRKDEI